MVVLYVQQMNVIESIQCRLSVLLQQLRILAQDLFAQSRSPGDNIIVAQIGQHNDACV